jgi:hypothetical protein
MIYKLQHDCVKHQGISLQQEVSVVRHDMCACALPACPKLVHWQGVQIPCRCGQVCDFLCGVHVLVGAQLAGHQNSGPVHCVVPTEWALLVAA